MLSHADTPTLWAVHTCASCSVHQCYHGRNPTGMLWCRMAHSVPQEPLQRYGKRGCSRHASQHHPDHPPYQPILKLVEIGLGRVMLQLVLQFMPNHILQLIPRNRLYCGGRHHHFCPCIRLESSSMVFMANYLILCTCPATISSEILGTPETARRDHRNSNGPSPIACWGIWVPE